MKSTFARRRLQTRSLKAAPRIYGLLPFLSALFAMGMSLQASEVVLRTVSAGSFANLLRNGNFAQTNSTGCVGWTASPNGYRAAAGEGRSNTTALVCEAPAAGGWRGASQTLALNRTNSVPITIRGWSRAQDVTGNTDNDYSLYVDIVHTDGTPLWGQTGNFRTGTHDWEPAVFTIYPAKPVRSLSLYCLFRGPHAGKVWFDDVAIEEVRTSGPVVLFQGSPMELVSDTNTLPPATTTAVTGDGLRLGMAGQRVVSLEVDNRALMAPVFGGFMARDVERDSDVCLFQDGACPELDLRLDASVRAQSNHILIEGRVTDSARRDRAVMLLFALPIEAAGWQWHLDLHQARPILGRDEFSQTTAVDAGSTGTMSIYPLAALNDGRTGLALGIDMGCPNLYRLVYHAGTRQFFVACDFGLVPDSDRSPGAADFRFVLFRFDPKWGWRAAWAKLQHIFPDYFTVRSKNQGIWMPFTDISRVEGWQDFGFRYQEGAPNIRFDDQHGILSFRYTEPMTWWMPMTAQQPRTMAQALEVRDALAQGPPSDRQRMAMITQSAAMFDARGQPLLKFIDAPWSTGAVWSLNPNPFLPASPNAATVYWNDAIKAQMYRDPPPAGQDGEYLDSLEGYVTAELNFKRDHFRWTSVPLAFTRDTRQPALFKGLAVYEFTRWISEDVHRLGRLVFANGVPYRFSFLCPWLDVLGTETDWFQGKTYQPASHTQMAYWRTLAGAKPYLLLMNTDFEALGPYVEKYFQRCLIYGFYPSMFSHNASENPYWRKPAWYNRDRPLFLKYMPIIRRVAEAGWQPVTGAVCDNPGIGMERFGPDTEGVRYYTLHTDTTQTQTGIMLEDEAVVGSNVGCVATELLSKGVLAKTAAGWRVEVPPQSTVVIRVEPGPRFRTASLAPGGTRRLIIDTPVELPQILEATFDLSLWKPLALHTPTFSPWTIELPPSIVSNQFFRLRF
jgi:hypothetical protein